MISRISVCGLAATALAAMVSNEAHAKKVTFQYAEMACVCEATIDDSKFKPDEFKSAVDFAIGLNRATSRGQEHGNTEPPAGVDAAIKNLDEIRKANLALVPREDLFKDEKWKTERAAAIHDMELEHYRDLKNLEYRKTKNHKVLLEPFLGKPLPEKCQKFGKALGSDAETRKVAAEFGQIHCQKNVNYLDCMSRNYTGPIERVRGSLLTYGWSNCVNDMRRIGVSGAPYLMSLLKKSMLKNNCECEEP